MIHRLSLLTALLAAGALGAQTPPPVQKHAAVAQAGVERMLSVRHSMGLNNDHAFSFKSQNDDEKGHVHTRLQQTFRGVKVWGGEAIHHADVFGNPVAEVTDALHRNLTLSTEPSLGHHEALAVAHDILQPRGKYAHAPETELVIFPIVEQRVRTEKTHLAAHELNAVDMEDVVTGQKLAYHIHTELQNGAEETAHTDFIIDAHTGEVLKSWSTLMTSDTTATARTQYSGTVTIHVNSTATGYELRDTYRAMNIATYNLNHATSGQGTLYTNTTTTWGDGANYISGGSTTNANGQTAAVDAHYGIEMTYDFYKNLFGRNGIDGNNRATYSSVHYGSNYDNAFWSDSCFCMTYGDGSSFKSLEAMDVAGHEMSHGVCSNTADLNYSGEPGGLNEANSDMFGNMVELYTKSGFALPATVPNTDGCWKVGEQLATTPLRYMYKPSLDGASKDAWSSTLGNLDVHYSSGPANRMFFFLSQGASNSSSTNYYSSYAPNGFTGIGPEKAIRIWYKALTSYMTSTTNYAGARTACLSAAQALYGSTTSPEYYAVMNAFGAINVGALAPIQTPLAIGTQPVSKTVASGSSVTFTVSATGGTAPYTYQWYKNGAALSGATSATYTFTTASSDNGATFYAKVTDSAATPATVTSNTATLTVNTSTATERILNGGFESGATSWSGTTGAIGNWSSYGEPSYEGLKAAYLGGNGSTTTETLYQTVTIPSTATSATLSFYLHIDTQETGTTVYDKLAVQVRNSAGSLLSTLANYSNANAASGYQVRTFNLTAYKGQTIRVHFNMTEDSSLKTSFLVDKVSLITQ